MPRRIRSWRRAPVHLDVFWCGGIDAFNYAAEAPNLTIQLVRRGYTEKQLGQLWGGNLLRVMEQAARLAAAAHSMFLSGAGCTRS
jgi:hypothetical protein